MVNVVECIDKLVTAGQISRKIADEARGDPSREATTVVIGIHPFVVGTPDGAAAMRRVLLRLKSDQLVWLTDTATILEAAGLK
jgi:allantoinase